jgi:hypothetical protein
MPEFLRTPVKTGVRVEMKSPRRAVGFFICGQRRNAGRPAPINDSRDNSAAPYPYP